MSRLAGDHCTMSRTPISFSLQRLASGRSEEAEEVFGEDRRDGARRTSRNNLFGQAPSLAGPPAERFVGPFGTGEAGVPWRGMNASPVMFKSYFRRSLLQ
jgi:hypothetical protein